MAVRYGWPKYVGCDFVAYSTPAYMVMTVLIGLLPVASLPFHRVYPLV